MVHTTTTTWMKRPSYSIITYQHRIHISVETTKCLRSSIICINIISSNRRSIIITPNIIPITIPIIIIMK